VGAGHQPDVDPFQVSPSHSLTLSLSHLLTISLSHSLTFSPSHCTADEGCSTTSSSEGTT
jgi:hypothetical protein